jgi:plastocyanin
MRRFTDVPPGRSALILGGAIATLLVGAAAVRAGAPPATVGVRLSEWKVEVATATVPAGPVVFHVVNGGRIEHALEVEGKGLERRTAPIVPGAEGTLNVTLKPGRYELYCPLGGGAHKQAGMKTMVTVTEDSAPSSQY